jgi:hypothetical protein
MWIGIWAGNHPRGLNDSRRWETGLGSVRRDSSVEIGQKRLKGQCILACSVRDGVKGRDITANTLQPVAGKDGNRLRILLDNLLY